MNRNKFALETQETELKTIDEGRELVDNIQNEINATVEDMKTAKTNDQHTALSDTKYELVKAKRHIQSEMQRLVRR